MNAVFDIMKNSPKGCTALDLENIKHIINTNDINIQDNFGRTTLALCCAYNISSSIEIIKMLLKNGADVNIQDTSGSTALLLHCCNIHRDTETIKLLVKYNANINLQRHDGRTALMSVSIIPNCTDIEIAKILLMSRVKNGADVNIQDNEGYTAIMNTERYSDTQKYSLKMSQLLLEYDAKPYKNSIFVDNIAKLNTLS